MSEHDTKVQANHNEIEEACMKNYEDLTERELRIQLAASYRLVEELGWSFLIFGHLTARVPGPEKHFLINPYGLMYDEVTASNLVKIDLEGNIVEKSEWNINPSILAHQYALSAEKVSSVILGVKNREELLECIEAESLGELNQDQISAIDTALSR